ncbi:proton-conducting transporter transmembrane domain-containing protein [Candidatus Desulforudis audaxviator]|uniref:NADH dehydrogenase (Quinone) n=1 Tax=Desulforudis audaxviator (strain MP104C) TaxID=477974 RepID=B1I6I4_DESAP|nr:proton-conducting transporter membrane subunit [Candidatus Desulforudis audaxviator]ACA60647.1 NADH dehydrogenase (quinone) [Candidatus Desulforudis audaxviator MP104C]AZK60730.1 monovalent cation/H+ antiporter subunit D family protein [Candidatus Desulforudis audaxviator]
MPAEVVFSNAPLVAVLVSLAAAGLILFCDRRPDLRETVTMAAAVVKFVVVLSMLPAVLGGAVVETAPLHIAKGIALHFRVDAFGLLFALLASGLWIVTSVYSIGYMRSLKYGHETGYFASFAVCLSAAVGIAMSGNLLTFFIFYEILTIATYPLVIHRRNAEAVSGGREYMVYLLLAGQVLLIAVAWAHYLVPGAAFTPGGFLAASGASVGALQVLFVLFMVGVGVKAAVLPLHGWLPTAMVAPTPVSALLHAVAVVKAGAFAVVRVTGFVFGPELMGELGVGVILAWFAAATIIFASLRALSEDHLKRRLAYSTVSQLSYVVLGAALATPAAILGAMFHIVAHAFMKITLFFCAGAIYATTHKEYIRELDGLGRRMPYTMGAFAAAALAITGMPLLVGFISKWNLGVGSIQAGQPVFIAVLIGSALLNAAYFFPIVYRAYFGRAREVAAHAAGEALAAGEPVAAARQPGDEVQTVRSSAPAAQSAAAHAEHAAACAGTSGEAKPSMLVPLLITAAAALVLGVLPNLGLQFYTLAEMAAAAVTGGGPGPAGGGM